MLRHHVIVIIKRKLSGQQGEKYDPQTPHINLLPSVFFALQHLGSTVANCPAIGLQITHFAFIFTCEAEITKLDILILVE